MMLAGKAGVALSAVVLCALGTVTGFTAEPGKISCVRVSAPTIATISAEGPAYDIPGGAKVGYLLPGLRYASGATVRDTDGETWILLLGSGSRHAGWFPRKAVRIGGVASRCDFPLELLYGKRR